jgi:crotonobetainyl-CoA:carnitine CoA-transferase CaiB-like acyl-CoA transferase
LDEAPNDLRLRARDTLFDLQDELLGTIRQIGSPLKLSETPGSFRNLGPAKRQHTLEILQSLSHTSNEIEALRQSGAILLPSDTSH